MEGCFAVVVAGVFFFDSEEEEDEDELLEEVVVGCFPEADAGLDGAALPIRDDVGFLSFDGLVAVIDLTLCSEEEAEVVFLSSSTSGGAGGGIERSSTTRLCSQTKS